MKTEATALSRSVKKRIRQYLEDPDTRVFINHNNELGEWLYCIEVVGSDGFWLCSFDSEQAAKDYIACNNLKTNNMP